MAIAFTIGMDDKLKDAFFSFAKKNFINKAELTQALVYWYIKENDPDILNKFDVDDDFPFPGKVPSGK